jgi:hypothetical protein
MIEVVDPDDPWKLVEYGTTGRTRLTTLTKEFFMPRFLERDECERERPCEQYPVGRRSECTPVLKVPKICRRGRVLTGSGRVRVEVRG